MVSIARKIKALFDRLFGDPTISVVKSGGVPDSLHIRAGGKWIEYRRVKDGDDA